MTTKYEDVYERDELLTFLDPVDAAYHNPLVEFILKFKRDSKIKITLDLIEEKTDEETVTITYKELLYRATDEALNISGVNVWYVADGGDPDTKKTIPKSVALEFMNEYEFEARKNKN